MFSTWVKPCATTLALYFWMVPLGPHLMQKTHLLPTTLRPFGCGTTSYTLMCSKAHTDYETWSLTKPINNRYTSYKQHTNSTHEFSEHSVPATRWKCPFRRGRDAHLQREPSPFRCTLP